MHTSYSGSLLLIKKAAFHPGHIWPRKTRRRSNRAAKFSSHELESADAGVMSRSNPCDLQTPLLELQAAACRSGARQEPLIRLVGVLTSINPSLTRRRSGWEATSNGGLFSCAAAMVEAVMNAQLKRSLQRFFPIIFYFRLNSMI